MGGERRQRLVDELRLDRQHDDGWRCGQPSLMPRRTDTVARHQRGGLRRRRRILYEDMCRIEPLPEPAGEQGPAHLPRTAENERAGEMECHACPCVSSMVARSASSGDLPAHSTNWKDW